MPPPHGQQATTPPGTVGWRTEQLHRAGFSEPLASRLAAERGYDILALFELVERGCAPELAARIMAPLDEQQGPA